MRNAVRWLLAVASVLALCQDRDGLAQSPTDVSIAPRGNNYAITFGFDVPVSGKLVLEEARINRTGASFLWKPGRISKSFDLPERRLTWLIAKGQVSPELRAGDVVAMRVSLNGQPPVAVSATVLEERPASVPTAVPSVVAPAPTPSATLQAPPPPSATATATATPTSPPNLPATPTPTAAAAAAGSVTPPPTRTRSATPTRTVIGAQAATTAVVVSPTGTPIPTAAPDGAVATPEPTGTPVPDLVPADVRPDGSAPGRKALVGGLIGLVVLAGLTLLVVAARKKPSEALPSSPGLPAAAPSPSGVRSRPPTVSTRSGLPRSEEPPASTPQVDPLVAFPLRAADEPSHTEVVDAVVPLPQPAPESPFRPSAPDARDKEPTRPLGMRPLELKELRIQRRLATGGICEIYVAEHPDGGPCALKVLRPEYRKSERMIDHLVREGRVLQQMNAAYPAEAFIRLLDSGRVRDASGIHPFLRMEYIDGGDLKSIVRARGAVPAADALDIVFVMSSALVALHSENLVHGDISPENILFVLKSSHDSEVRHRYRLIDFGDARRFEIEARGQEIAGKPHFLSPEQCDGFPATPSSDIYSLGMVLYYLYFGRPAFDPPNALEVLAMHKTHDIAFPKTAPAPVVSLIRSLCARLPILRPDASTVRETLKSLGSSSRSTS